ncbi:hypothetical protein A5819_001413 [Enterococcus sp. 7E2_DIV0204]|uniref:MucBP domain-containing protein n=1 Tax=unclassified Enterococcus TaxID=2608891 RepID=UPI000A32E2D0|nr:MULTISPECIES: MucBP domain-containing protein [unclassified Enterococcus]OTN88921.1 hypothetical protein A5819_001413 [Enterococcus sp. 7E2_DIV0204]OTP51378.1 hypothetical protein A5884_000573 [Enterococcus sp. 7D2_DIV0200]
MRRKILLFMLSVILIFGLGFTNVSADSSDIVNIPDVNLRDTVKKSLGLTSDSDLTKENLLKLTEISSNNNNISSVEGLQYALNLRSINLAHNSIVDLDPLKPIFMNWQEYDTSSYFVVNLANNEISSLEVFQDISSLPTYSVFHFESNQIRDFSPMSHFPDNTFYASYPNDQTIILPTIHLMSSSYSFNIPYLNTGFPESNQQIEISYGGTVNNGTAQWNNLTKDGELSVSHSNYRDGPFGYKVTYIQPYVMEKAKVVAKYVDNKGNVISGDVVLTDNVGEKYTTEQKKIVGYTFKEVQGNASGIFTDQEQTVTYVYTKNSVAGGTVTTRYVDESGNPISENTVFTGNIGESYTTEQKIIADYTFKEVQGNPTGTFTEEEQTINYVYKENKKETNNTTGPSDNDQLPKKNETSNQKMLPKTGEKENRLLIIVGILLSSSLLLVFFYGKETIR